MKKFTLIASLIIAAFSFNTQAKDTNFVMDAKDTALNGLFKNAGNDSQWPKLAITTLSNNDEDCLIAKATIWRSESRKETIPSFKICADRKLGGAKLAYFAGVFENQMDVMNNTGETRTEGPFPPSRAVPGLNDYDASIMYQLSELTKWQPNIDTNFWVVNSQIN